MMFQKRLTRIAEQLSERLGAKASKLPSEVKESNHSLFRCKVLTAEGVFNDAAWNSQAAEVEHVLDVMVTTLYSSAWELRLANHLGVVTEYDVAEPEAEVSVMTAGNLTVKGILFRPTEECPLWRLHVRLIVGVVRT